MSTSALLRDGRDDAANLPPGGGAVEGHASPSFARSPLTIAVTLIRLLLIFNALLPADLSEWLYSANLRSVLIDPVFTMHHVQEAGAVRHLSSRTKLPRGHGDFVRAYRGHETGNSRVHLPPLVLAAAEALRRQIPSEWQNVALALLVLLVDVCIAQRLEQLAARALRREEAREVEWHRKMDPKIRPALAHIFPLAAATIQSSLLRWQDLPFFVAHLYFSNPITVLAGSVAAMRGCFQNGGVLLLVTALAEASSEGGSVVLAAFALAVATYWDLHSAVFVFPCALWVGGEKAKTVGVLWGVFFIALQGLASLLLGDENYLSVFTATHLHQYRLKGLAPSLTTLWYFGMESFIRFRLYFECLLGGLPYFLVVPVVLRLYLYPSVLVRANAGFNVWHSIGISSI